MTHRRILYLCGDQGIPAFGRKGASTHLREMIAAFRELGHEVCLAATDLSGDRRPGEDFPAVELPSPKSRKLGLDGRYLLANMRARPALRKAVREFQPDAIYERSALYFSAGETVAREAGIPRILEVNCLLSEEQKTRLHFPGLARKRELTLIGQAPAVAAISDYMVDWLARETGRNRANTHAFPMAVNPDRFPPQPRNLERRRALGWPEDCLVLGYVGSMNSYHRPVWFMDLAEKLLRRGQNGLRFLIVGGSDTKVEKNRARLLNYVNSGLVHFTGSVPQEAMGEWLAAMDAVLIPGAAPQSTPTKIFEAAAVGRPVLMPATGPIRSLCGEAAPNCLFKPEDFRAFEAKVSEFREDPACFHTESHRLHEAVVANHTWRRHAEELTAWFEQLDEQARP